MIKIERIDNFQYSFRFSDKTGMKNVARALTFKNPDVFARNRNIEKFDKRNYTFPIGMLLTLEKYCKENQLKINITDYKYEFPENITIDNRLCGKYIHQYNAVKAFYKKRFGIIVVPTRGGKTFIASEILRIFLLSEKEGNFLFCVDNTTLFNQAVEDIKKFFEPYQDIEIGEIRAGKIDTTKRVTVAMIQTIQSTFSSRCKDKVKQRTLKQYMHTLKFLCVDEIHDNCSDSKLKLYKTCKSLEYQLCLSATPYRSEALVQNLKLKAWSGDVCYEISEDELRNVGVLSDYKVFELLVDHNNIDYDIDLDDCDYNELRKRLIFQSDVRNSVLLSVIDIVNKLKLKTLVLFQSIEHGNTISNITGLPFISGADKDEKREEEKKKFLDSRDGGILLASNIFKKGVTLPDCEVLISVDGGLEDANTVQKKGRVLGTTKDKNRSLIIDFIDVYDVYFSEHSEARLNTYINAIGESKVGILDTSADDCYETLNEWIKKWFKL